MNIHSFMHSSKTIFATLALAACSGGGGADTAANGGASNAGSETTVGSTESDLNAKGPCDTMQVFVKQGLAQDLRATVDSSFVKGGYEVEIPHAIWAFDSYGGDMVYAPLGGVRSTIARVFDVNPGGPTSAIVGGFPGGESSARRGSLPRRRSSLQ